MDKKTFNPHPLSPGARNVYPLTHRACDSEGESEDPLVNTDCFNDYDPSLLSNIDPDINYLNSNKKVLNTPYYNESYSVGNSIEIMILYQCFSLTSEAFLITSYNFLHY